MANLEKSLLCSSRFDPKTDIIALCSTLPSSQRFLPNPSSTDPALSLFSLICAAFTWQGSKRNYVVNKFCQRL
ncbi:hypothetical protein AC579_115 [Pseudocercospora musae]|uniref:Uncharacterized protein n=1 Tax=Pseudocercospora musae TaxID=113226 RepID=A0A139HI90_9PEZI|nr:hypothetical protein AC579_115 [Pseudocercospora musae]